MKLLRGSPAEVEIFRWLQLSRFNLIARTASCSSLMGRIGFIGGVGIADAWDGDADAASPSGATPTTP